MTDAIAGIRAAFVFLTRIPMGTFPYRDAEWRWATAHFPFVGGVLGALLGALAYLVGPHLGPTVAALTVVGAGLLLTGAFHEDGLADTADALGGAYDRERLFTILKDSRIGTFGGAALIVALSLRVALLTRLGASMPVAIVVAQACSRTPPIWQLWLMPYVTADARARSRQVARAGLGQVVVATAWGALAVGWGVGWGGIPLERAVQLVAASLIVAAWLGRRFQVRAGGLTGDFLGATQQGVELIILAVLAWR